MLFTRLALGSDEKVPSRNETKPPSAVADPVLIAIGSFQAPEGVGWKVGDAAGDAWRSALTGCAMLVGVGTAAPPSPLPHPATARSNSPAVRIRTPAGTQLNSSALRRLHAATYTGAYRLR